MLLTIAATLVVLGVLIFVHELGHFIAAKSVGIGVPRFSIGLGPVTPIRFTRGETEYVVSWIPFGGYVKMASREEAEVVQAVEGGAADEFPAEKLFENKPLAARILVISAGVFMNALFAWAAYSFVAGVFGRPVDPTVTMAGVDSERLPVAAAALAEIPFGTDILRINGDTVSSWNDVFEKVTEASSRSVTFEFVADLAPVRVEIPGTASEDRLDLFLALRPARQPRVGIVFPGLPAAESGLKNGDLILFANGDTVRTFADLRQVVEANVEKKLELVVERQGTRESLSVVPELQREVDRESGEVREVGRIGVGQWLEHRRVGPGEAVIAGFGRVVADGANIFAALRGWVTGELSPRELGGPIFIGQLSGQVARLGPAAFLSFMAFFSVNLAILNLLPIPVLDGGHLVFLILEGLRGKPLSTNVRLRLSQIGLTLLLGLMLLAVSNDLLRLFD